MSEYKVVEKFVSINGEGTRAGTLAVFIRFKGCNLNCSYCDTKWANEPDCEYEIMTEDDIAQYIIETKVFNVTLTGGEPLLRDGMEELLRRIASIPDISVEIETNGSIDLTKYRNIADNILFTMDYKLACSNMEKAMCTANFALLGKKDTVKFVAADIDDLETAKDVIDKYNLAGRVNIYISPVFGKIEPVDIVEFMIKNNLNLVNMQLQMHKLIWEPDKKGV